MLAIAALVSIGYARFEFFRWKVRLVIRRLSQQNGWQQQCEDESDKSFHSGFLLFDC